MEKLQGVETIHGHVQNNQPTRTSLSALLIKTFTIRSPKRSTLSEPFKGCAQLSDVQLISSITLFNTERLRHS